jgi:essential nuclear protein 1
MFDFIGASSEEILKSSMPGKERRRKNNHGHNPLGDDVNAARFASFKKGAEDGDDVGEDDSGFLIPNHTTQRILKAARRQMSCEDNEEIDEEDGTEELPEDEETVGLAEDHDYHHDELGDEEDEEEVEVEYDDHESVQSEVQSFADLGDEYQISDEEMRLMQKFQPQSAMQTRNLADIIMEKIHEKERIAKLAAAGGSSTGEGGEGGEEDGTARVDKRVARVYSAIGTILKSYTSGKIPKAFKILPHIQNWEQLIMLTRPHDWSPHAAYNATRIFAANLNEKMAQRFYASVLLPIVHHRIQEDRKLHPSLYMAVKKALFKPVAFYKGFLLPLAQDEECTLKESLIIASILQKVHLPPVPTAVTIVKISRMPFSGPSCVLLRVLVDKKMALPFQAVDALVKYFHRFASSHGKEEVLPVLWHQTFLSFVQRYKEDLTPEQLALLLQVCTRHFHHLITPEVRREISLAQGKKSWLH